MHLNRSKLSYFAQHSAGHLAFLYCKELQLSELGLSPSADKGPTAPPTAARHRLEALKLPIWGAPEAAGHSPRSPLLLTAYNWEQESSIHAWASPRSLPEIGRRMAAGLVSKST